MMLYRVPTKDKEMPIAPLHESFEADPERPGSSEMQAFIDMIEVNATHVAVADAQEKLVECGLLELCLHIVGDESNFSSPCLQLMRAVLDGDQESSVEKFRNQLVRSDTELFVVCYRRLLSKSITAWPQVFKATKLGGEAYREAVSKAGIIHSGEIIAVMSSLVTGDAWAMQGSGIPGYLSSLGFLHRKSICMAVLYGGTGCLTAQNGVSRPGQITSENSLGALGLRWMD